MAQKKLIIFDYDGTIADTFTLTCHIYNEIFREFNIPKSFTKRQYQDLFEVDWRLCLKKIGINDPKKFERCSEIYYRITDDFMEEIRLYPKVRTVLVELSKKYKLAIVSNGSKERIIKRAKFLDIEKHFDYIAGNETGEKPSPESILKCIEHFGFKPEECVYIGDMDGDIIAGKAAKCGKTIAVTYGYHFNERLKDADVIVNKPLEILEILEQDEKQQ